MNGKHQVKTSSAALGSTSSSHDQQLTVLPPVDIFEDAEGITLLADMAGVQKEQLDVKIEGETLLIEGGVQTRAPDGLDAVYAELRVPRYRRSFMLGRELDPNGIEANLKNGALTLRIPKLAQAQPRRITINTGP